MYFVADFFGGLFPAVLYWLLSALIVAMTLAYRAPFFKCAYMEIHAKSNNNNNDKKILVRRIIRKRKGGKISRSGERVT